MTRFELLMERKMQQCNDTAAATARVGDEKTGLHSVNGM
jgi:hypothetical protein